MWIFSGVNVVLKSFCFSCLFMIVLLIGILDCVSRIVFWKIWYWKLLVVCWVIVIFCLVFDDFMIGERNFFGFDFRISVLFLKLDFLRLLVKFFVFGESVICIWCGVGW